MQKSLAATEEQEEKASHSLAVKASTCRHFAEGERRRGREEEIARGKEAGRERQRGSAKTRARRFCSGSDISGQNGGSRRKERRSSFLGASEGGANRMRKRVQLGGQNGGEDVSAPDSCKAEGVRLPTSPRLSGEHRGGRSKVFERIP